MEPTQQEVVDAGLNNIASVIAWAGAELIELPHFATMLGFSNEALATAHPRLLCCIEDAEYAELVRNWMIPGPNASASASSEIRAPPRMRMVATSARIAAGAIMRMAAPQPVAAPANTVPQDQVNAALLALAAAMIRPHARFARMMNSSCRRMIIVLLRQRWFLELTAPLGLWQTTIL